MQYIRMPELLEELIAAKEHMELKKTMKAYEKVDLLILDEWLIRCLTPDETYAMLELIVNPYKTRFHDLLYAI